MDRIKNQDIPVAAQSAMPVKQVGFGRREQRFACSDWGCVAPRYCGDRFKVQRIANVLEPPEPARGKRIGDLKAGRSGIGVYGINRDIPGTVEQPCRGIDPFQILSQWSAADLDLGALVEKVAKTAYFIGKISDVT